MRLWIKVENCGRIQSFRLVNSIRLFRSHTWHNCCRRCLSAPSNACTSSPSLSKPVYSWSCHPATCNLGACWSSSSLYFTSLVYIRISYSHWDAKIGTGRVAQPDLLLQLTHSVLRRTHTQSTPIASMHSDRPAPQLAPNIKAINGAPK